MPESSETSSKNKLILSFAEAATLLIVAVKLPDEIPRVLPMELDMDLSVFLSEFNTTWKDIGEKVRAEFIRGVTGRESDNDEENN